LNKLVAVLAASTAVSASAALYWRHQLVEERARNALQVEPHAPPAGAAQAAAPVAPPATAQAPPENAASTAKVEAPKPAAAGPLAPASSGLPDARPPISAKATAAQRKQAADFLKKYDDPFGRNELRGQALERARRGLEGFDQERNLDAGTFEKLVALIADQELERRVAQSRCMADPQCEGPSAFADMFAAQRQSINDLIGAGGDAAVRDWNSTQSVRRMVKGFSARLPATAQLSETQSNAFVAALKTERDAAMQEWAMNHQPVQGFGNMDGMMVMYLSQPATTEDRLASAQVYVQRMKDRAATVLSGQQLMVYNQMQDELLFDLQRHLKSRERQEREGGS
jgi:hypothetical protein